MNQTLTTLSGPAIGPGLRQRFAHAVARAAEALLSWQDRARQRSQVASLDDRILRDIGLSRAEVDGEARKPFWIA